MAKKSDKIIGIDLGTGFSVVSVFSGNDVAVITNSEGKRTTPSVVSIKGGEIKVGDAAKRAAVVQPQNTIYSVKRLMGKTYDQVKDLHLPYKIVNEKGRPKIDIDGKKYSPEEISAMILQKMKKTAEEYLGEEVERAVITVPAYWGNAEKESTKIAGEIAGLKVERIINEPTAAALAYGIDKHDKEEKILVFDEGSGTHDISIIDFSGGVFEVLATDGNTQLGGDDVDEIIINWLAKDFKDQYKIDLKKDPMALQRLKEAAEKAKIELSSSASTEINLPYISSFEGNPVHLVKNITRSQFERMIDKFVDQSIDPIQKCLDKAKLKKEDINEVILMGGSTRIPIIKERVSKFFGGKVLNQSVSPDEGVSIGATIQGGVISGQVKDVLLLDILPISIGIETMGNVFTKMIEFNTTIPTRKEETFSTASDNQPSVEIHILQGERTMAKDNKSLGKFHLDDIMPAPRGIPKITVLMDIDANGILSVTAKDAATGKENKIRIENSTHLSKDEIEKMKKEAEINAESDKKERELVDKLNTVDNQIFSTERQIKEFGDKLSESNKTELNSILSELRSAHSLKDVDKMNTISSNLNDAWSKISTEIYSKTNEAQNAEPTQEPNEQKVEDATYEEVKN